MDSLHRVLRTIRTETKSAPNHLDVFREFLARLDELQRQASVTQSREQTRRKPLKRSKAG